MPEARKKSEKQINNGEAREKTAQRTARRTKHADREGARGERHKAIKQNGGAAA